MDNSKANLESSGSESQIHFVISAPRSGSTWLTTALNHHPSIFATEHRLFGKFCEVWKNNDGTSQPRITLDKYADAFSMHYFYQFMDLTRPEFVDEFQVAFIEFITGFARKRTGKSIVIDKITPYPGTASYVVAQINKLLPNAKIIQLVRDGRDVLTSGTFDWLLKDGEGTKRHDFFVGQKPGTQLDRFFDEAVIEKWAQNWRETIDAFDGSANQTLVSYEQMKENLSEQLTRIFDAVGAEASGEIISRAVGETTFEKMAGRSAGEEVPTAKARKGVVGDWKNYFTRSDGEMFHSLAGQQLIELGYEPSDEWIQKLPESLEMVCE